MVCDRSGGSCSGDSPCPIPAAEASGVPDAYRCGDILSGSLAAPGH